MALPGPAPARPPVRTVEIDGHAVRYVDEGQGAPVLLLHGLAGSHRWWAEVIGPLAEERRVLALDLPGFGRSDKPDASYSIPWLAGKVLRFLDALGVARAALVGNSLGGQIALAISLGQPERVERLVLAAPAGVTPWPPVLLGIARLLDATGAISSGGGLPASLPRVPEAMIALACRAVFPEPPRRSGLRSDRQKQEGRLADRFTRGLVRAMASPDYPAAARATLRALRGSLGHPLGTACSSLTVPTLVVWGERDRILPVAGARLLRKHIDGAELLVYADSGHCPMIDAPERFARDVGRFLAGQPTGV